MHTLIEKHIGYAHAIAADVLKKYPSLDRRDLESAAEMGLVQAANDYDPSRGVSFATFAYYRIRGAIYDDIRQVSRISKFETSANDYMTDYTATGPGRTPKSVAGELADITSHLVTTYLFSHEARLFEGSAPGALSPVDQVMWTEQRDRLRNALRELRDRYRQVLESYYFEDLSFKEIGHQLGLSESWVSRIHGQGLRLIRDLLQQNIKSSAVRVRAEKYKAFPLARRKAGSSSSITMKEYHGPYNSEHLSTIG